MRTKDLLEFIVACERQASWTAAVQLEAMAEFSDRRPVIEAPDDTARSDVYNRYAADEVACALHLSTVTADHRLAFAWELDASLKATLSALRSGDITISKARVIADRTNGLSDEARRDVEQAALSDAVQRTPGELRRIVDRAVFLADPPSPRSGMTRRLGVVLRRSDQSPMAWRRSG
jgi:hypothetical protein